MPITMNIIKFIYWKYYSNSTLWFLSFLIFRNVFTRNIEEKNSSRRSPTCAVDSTSREKLSEMCVRAWSRERKKNGEGKPTRTTDIETKKSLKLMKFWARSLVALFLVIEEMLVQNYLWSTVARYSSVGGGFKFTSLKKNSCLTFSFSSIVFFCCNNNMKAINVINRRQKKTLITEPKYKINGSRRCAEKEWQTKRTWNGISMRAGERNLLISSRGRDQKRRRIRHKINSALSIYHVHVQVNMNFNNDMCLGWVDETKTNEMRINS